MDEIEKRYVHKELSGKIIGAVMEVLNVIKPGLAERIYENTLVEELLRHGHTVEQQREFARLQFKRIVY